MAPEIRSPGSNSNIKIFDKFEMKDKLASAAAALKKQTTSEMLQEAENKAKEQEKEVTNKRIETTQENVGFIDEAPSPINKLTQDDEDIMNKEFVAEEGFKSETNTTK